MFSFLFLAACSYNGSLDLPGLYRVDIQQGNVLDQDMLDRLRPGMGKAQVEFILGTPAFIDPFHTEQWEYFFSIAEEGDNRRQRHLRVHFIDDKLAYIDGDVKVANRDLSDPGRQVRTVDVPPDRGRRQGFFQRMFSSIPLLGEPQPRRVNPPDTAEEGTVEEDTGPSE
jgi:outer membrane protein assembly factor BamE